MLHHFRTMFFDLVIEVLQLRLVGYLKAEVTGLPPIVRLHYQPAEHLPHQTFFKKGGQFPGVLPCYLPYNFPSPHPHCAFNDQFVLPMQHNAFGLLNKYSSFSQVNREKEHTFECHWGAFHLIKYKNNKNPPKTVFSYDHDKMLTPVYLDKSCKTADSWVPEYTLKCRRVGKAKKVVELSSEEENEEDAPYADDSDDDQEIPNSVCGECEMPFCGG